MSKEPRAAIETSIIKKAIFVYGKTAQKVKAIEELSELSFAIAKDINNYTDINNIIEEIADVGIMLDQLIILYNCKEKADNARRIKLERLKERLQNE